MRHVLTMLLALSLAACGQARVQSGNEVTQEPGIFDDHVVARDGYRLPLHRWFPQDGPLRAVVLGLHGFGDYGGSFEALSGTLNASGIAVYAYDQRGFGATAQPGVWGGQAHLVGDARLVVSLIRARHPDLPLYLVGKSMGGAVAIRVMAAADPPVVDGTVLIAPAVWGRETMPWYQRLGLRVLLSVAPGMHLTGNAAHDLGIRPTDDPAVSRALSLDPLVQKRYRVDAVHGLTTLMGTALDDSARLPGPALILYGHKDHVIPARPMCAMLARLPDARTAAWRMTLYPDGYHMLTRYTGAAATHQDVAAWILDPFGTLPSGAEVDRTAAHAGLCGGTGGPVSVQAPRHTEPVLSPEDQT